MSFIRKQIKEIFGDQTVNCFFDSFKMVDWEDSPIYRGQLADMEDLWAKEEITKGENPTAIYPDTKEWSLTSYINNPFTFIGGSKALIDKITEAEEFEIFRLEPRFWEKITNLG